MELPQLVDWLTKLTPGAIFALLWWLERGERLDCQKALREINEKTINGLNNAAMTVQSLKDLLMQSRQT